MCAAGLGKGSEAWYDPASKRVRCPTCSAADGSSTEQVPDAPPIEVLEHGVAGASAQREYERRSVRRLAKIEAEVAADTAWRTEAKHAHPILGRIVAAATAKPTLGPEPQYIKAWTVGADGEQKVGHRLEEWAAADDDRVVLHDRRIPGTRANIDHLAVGAAGVWVIDAKEYAGKVEHLNAGTIFRPDWQLRVGGRNRSKLATGVQWQVSRVTEVLEAADAVLKPLVKGMLCFVGADWSWFAKPFVFEDIAVVWPLAAVEILSRPADSGANVTALAHILARAFPPA